MADPQLLEWIRAQQAQGFTIDQIRQYMYQMGYQQQIVEEALGQVNTPVKSGGSKVLVITAGIVLLIILILAAIFIFSGEEEQQKEEERIMAEEIVTETIKSGPGLTPEQLKSDILSAYINIRNYGFDKEVESMEGSDGTIVTIKDGRIDTKGKKVFYIPEAELKGALGEMMGGGSRGDLPRVEKYIDGNTIYYNKNSSWIKSTIQNTDEYLELKNVIELIQDSNIIMIENDGSHIRLVPENEDIGEFMMIAMGRDSPMAMFKTEKSTFEGYDFESWIQESNIFCWIDDESRVTKIEAEITINLQGSELKISTIVDFKGYNTQQSIVLPEMAKTAEDITPAGPGHEEGTGGGGETGWKKSTVFIYGSDQPYNPENPVSVVEEQADAINSTDVNKYRKTTKTREGMADSDLMALLTEKKNNLFLDKVEVFYCEDADTGDEVDCENPGNVKRLKVHIKGKKGGKSVESIITLVNEDGIWVETGELIEQDHDDMSSEQSSGGSTSDEDDDVDEDSDTPPDSTEEPTDDGTPYEEEWDDGSNQSGFGDDYNYQKGKPYDPQNPLTVFDAFATAVINLDPEAYREIVGTELEIDIDDLPPEWEGFTDSADVDMTQFPDEALIQYLNTTKNESLKTGYYKVLYCKNTLGTEEDCENPEEGVDTMGFFVEIKQEGNIAMMRRTVVRESTGWKIL